MTLSMDVQSSDSSNNNNNNNIQSIDNGVRRDIPWEELAAKLKGSIQIAGGEDIFTSRTYFNNATRPTYNTSNAPLAIATPECTMDVSHIVTFANEHNISISAKSGGYNPSNWHSAGQIVIELERLNGIRVQEGVQLSSLNKGKRKERELSPQQQRATSQSSSSSSSSSGSGSASGKKNGNGSIAQSTHDPSPDLRSEPGSAPPPNNPEESSSPSTSSPSNLGENNHRESQNGQAGGARQVQDVDMADSSTLHNATNGKGKRRALDNYRAESSSHHPDRNSAEKQDTAVQSGQAPYSASTPSNGEDPSGADNNKILPYTYPPLYLGNKDPQQAKEIQDRYNESIKEREASRKDSDNTAGQSSSSSGGGPSLQPTAPGAIPMNLDNNNNHNNNVNGRSSSSSSSSSTSYNAAYEQFGVQDPKHYVTVSFGAGIKAKDLDAHTSKYGYIVPLACYPVGTAIFITGGYGFVSRLFGLSMDLTTELEIVLPADGSIYTLYSDYASRFRHSPEEIAKQEELLWACRGAGTAFCIVTRITAKAYKIGRVLSGNLIYPYNGITTPSLLKHWRDCWKLAPRELYSNFTLTAGPSAAGHVVVVQFSWCGARQSDGEQLLQNFLSWDGERCLLKDIEVRPFSHQQDNVSQILSSKDDSRWLVRSTLINSLTDEAIHKTVDLFKSATAGTSWLFELSGGAIAEPEGPTCFPISHRKAPFQTAALHQWSLPGDDLINKEMAEKWIYGVLGSAPTPANNSNSNSSNTANGDSENTGNSLGPFPCFLGSGEGRERIIQIYGGQKNWERLKELKLKYDSKGLLRYTHFEDELMK